MDYGDFERLSEQAMATIPKLIVEMQKKNKVNI
jgi:hypothetical protein